VSPDVDFFDLTDCLSNPVSWVILDYKTGGLALIFLKVHLILYVISDLTDISTTLGDILD